MKMESYKYVIIGGGIAGGNAVAGIREIDADSTVALVTQETHLPYQRPPLSKGYLQGKSKLNKVYLRNKDYYQEKAIAILTDKRVVKLFPAKHTLLLNDGQELAFAKLLLATGSNAWRLPIEGGALSGVFTLRSIEDSDAIRKAAVPGKHALVLGGSFIGAEVAASLCEMGVDVTMVFPESRLLERIVPEDLSSFLKAKYEAQGVRILTGITPAQLTGVDFVEHAQLSNHETLDVNLVVMGVGIRLNTQLAKEAGLQLNASGAVMVDETLRTSDPDIYAAGDIAAWPDPTFNTRLRVEHWDVARRQGKHAGHNMVGNHDAYTTLPYFFSDMFDFSFEVWGNLNTWDRAVLQGELDADSFMFFYFNQGTMVGCLAVNPTDASREAIPLLVHDRPAYLDVAEQLRLGKLAM
jgi:3-phenylpropionate/trans-cinnamate dioxygenase ferredoxin reductase subunit